MKRYFAASLVLALVVSGCTQVGSFTCVNDSNCLRSGVQGACRQGACAAPDATCGGPGLRWGDSAPNGLAGNCVNSDGSDMASRVVDLSVPSDRDLAVPRDLAVADLGVPCCAPGTLCGGVCIDVSTDSRNCGGCGSVCVLPNSAPDCKAGACVPSCLAGWGDCDGSSGNGCEVNLNSDVNNCNGCNVRCPTPNNAQSTCTNGVCGVSACTAPFLTCGGAPCAINSSSDVNNCGGCGTRCQLAHATPGCNLGNCKVTVCDPGFVDCDSNPANGCEVDITADPKNCGGCNNVCSSQGGVASCVASTCQIKCNPGFGDCDGNAANGCETNTSTDVNHCGSCGQTCPFSQQVSGRSCVGGACRVTSCNAGRADCDGNYADGCEVDTSIDVSNCGSCGVPCGAVANGAPSCSGGKCGVGSCVVNYGDCDKDPKNGCETDLRWDPNNCSACGTHCANVMHCNNGNCLAQNDVDWTLSNQCQPSGTLNVKVFDETDNFTYPVIETVVFGQQPTIHILCTHGHKLCLGGTGANQPCSGATYWCAGFDNAHANDVLGPQCCLSCDNLSATIVFSCPNGC